MKSVQAAAAAEVCRRAHLLAAEVFQRARHLVAVGLARRKDYRAIAQAWVVSRIGHLPSAALRFQRVRLAVVESVQCFQTEMNLKVAELVHHQTVHRAAGAS